MHVIFTPLFDFLTRQNTSHQQSDFVFKGNGTRCWIGSFVLGLRKHETLELLKGAASFVQETATQISQSLCGPYDPRIGTI
jgi:hypothetical protein